MSQELYVLLWRTVTDSARGPNHAPDSLARHKGFLPAAREVRGLFVIICGQVFFTIVPFRDARQRYFTYLARPEQFAIFTRKRQLLALAHVETRNSAGALALHPRSLLAW
jgi:hypothetical protein